MKYIGNDVKIKNRIYSDFECEFCGKIQQLRKDSGKNKYSCGCVNKNKTTDGDSAPTSKYHFIYSRYKDIKRRCYDPKKKSI